MNCMEIVGGNAPCDVYESRPGLSFWLSSRSTENCTFGSEVHLMTSCASGRITRIVLAEIAGPKGNYCKAVEELKMMMKRHINSFRTGSILRKMEYFLRKSAGDGIYTTSLMASYFSPTRSLVVHNAGQPLPMYYSNETGRWSLLKGTAESKPTADSPDLGEYQQVKKVLAKGDHVLYLGSSVGDCLDEKSCPLGSDGLLRAVQDTPLQDPNSFCRDLLTRIEDANRSNRNKLENSRAVLCQATDTPPGWKRNLLAPFLLFRRVNDQTDFPQLGDPS